MSTSTSIRLPKMSTLTTSDFEGVYCAPRSRETAIGISSDYGYLHILLQEQISCISAYDRHLRPQGLSVPGLNSAYGKALSVGGPNEICRKHVITR